MNLAALLIELKRLLAEPEKNAAAVLSLLEDHDGLAEYQVARFYAQRSLTPIAESLSRSPDPRLRARAADAARVAIGPSRVSSIARRLAKDPDGRVRSRVHTLVQKLQLSDVALPDPRTAPRGERDFYAYRWAAARGQWKPYGWRFGLGTTENAAVRKLRGRSTPAAQSVKSLATRLKTPAALAKWLGFASEDDLTRFSRPGTAPGAGYVSFSIPKRTGGERLITAPKQRLKAAQRQILEQILDPLPTHANAHGFVASRSVVTNATPHEGSAVVVKLDLEDYFPTIHYRRVEGFFASLGFATEVARMLARLTTHRARLADGYVVWPGVLPQGAPTSPSLANHISGRLDARLTGLAHRVSAVYSRYADDLTFSFKVDPGPRLGRFFWWIDQILQQEGFAENASKRRVIRACGQQRVTGVVVNERAHVPREAKRRFRAILNNCKKHGVASQARDHADFPAYLRGFAAWVCMVEPEVGQKLRDEVEAVLATV